MKQFNGNVLFLDRDDINTDEIIPAKYLTETDKKALQPYLLEDLSLDGFNPVTDLENIQVIITRENFGCGSSREHAPWALEVNGINLVCAKSFARIFRQNMFNCGMIAAELPQEQIDELFDTFRGSVCKASVNLDEKQITFTGNGMEIKAQLSLSQFDYELVKAGGWVEYADKKY